jgi:hypothetical protein
MSGNFGDPIVSPYTLDIATHFYNLNPQIEISLTY